MTGIAGGFTTGDGLDAMAESLYREPWYQTSSVEQRGSGIALVDHGDRDSRANYLWEGEDGVGVVHGVVSATGNRFESLNDVFPALLEDPLDVLPALEGPFAIAAIDTTDDRVILATDKAGSRPLYYTDEAQFAFSSEVKTLLPTHPDPTVDVTAVADLLHMGWVVGTKTLVEGVNNLPPASVVVHADGETACRQYWRPTFDRYPETDYPVRWLEAFSTSVEDVSETVGDQLSLWLSGGIDSRATAAVLSQTGRPFDTLTYWNPNGRNPELAAEVASTLGVENRLLDPGTPEQFITGIQNSVSVTDGLMSWAPFVNLSFAFTELHDIADVVMEGGTFMGEDVWTHSLHDDTDPATVLKQKKSNLPTDEVRAVVSDSVDPVQSLRAELDRCGLDGDRERTLYGMRQLYAYSHMRSNIVQRSQVGTRVISHGPILEAALGIPDEYRMQTVPLTDGRIPAGVPKLKLEVMRLLDSGLDQIPYERTNLPPAVPYPAHLIGYGINQVREIARSQKSGEYIHWYRNHPDVGQFIDSLVDDVAERPFLNHDAVMDLRRRIRDGEHDDLNPIASLTALELWLQNHFE